LKKETCECQQYIISLSLSLSLSLYIYIYIYIYIWYFGIISEIPNQI